VLRQYMRSHQTGLWAGYRSDVHALPVSGWVKKKVEENYGVSLSGGV
jgi:hypothetical protein